MDLEYGVIPRDNSGDVPKATRRGYWKVQVVAVVDANADADADAG